MSQISRPTQFHGLESNFLGLTRTYNIAKAVNGGIDFGDSTQTNAGPGTAYSGNMNGQWANVTAPGAANTQFSIAHNLNRIPSFYFYIADRSCNLYQLPNTGTAWTTTNIFLKCDVASAVLRVFIT
jgi:choice-of-anchor A domain-containing protein